MWKIYFSYIDIILDEPPNLNGSQKPSIEALLFFEQMSVGVQQLIVTVQRDLKDFLQSSTNDFDLCKKKTCMRLTGLWDNTTELHKGSFVTTSKKGEILACLTL